LTWVTAVPHHSSRPSFTFAMPRCRMGRRGGAARNSAHRAEWANILSRTRLCKFNTAGLCNRGEACSFAHDVEELQPPPNLHFTKICTIFRQSGFCKQADRCSFAHSEEELRTSQAIAAQLATSQQECPPAREGHLSDGAEVPDSFSLECADNLDMTHTSLMGLSPASDMAEVKAAKTAVASRDIWSRQTTAEATSRSWSRQTTEHFEEEEVSRSHQSFDINFEASCAFTFKMQGLSTLEAFTCRLLEVEPKEGWIMESSGNDASSDSSFSEDDLELQVQNTFLAALPRRHPHRRASSWPREGSCFRKPLELSNFASH